MRNSFHASQTSGIRKPGRILTAVLIVACAGSLLSACGGGSDGTPTAQTNSLVAQTATYRVVYDPGDTTATEGKTTFTIQVNKIIGGDNVTGASIALTPKMRMTMGDHTTPGDNVVELGNGLYRCIVYFLMPTMGTEDWELKVAVNGETATFYPPVAMAMIDNTPLRTLRGQNDKFLGMSGATKRHYHVFRDKFEGQAGSHTFGVFIAARESAMNMPPLVVGSTLHDENTNPWTVDNVVVQASLDNGATWFDATSSSGPRWEFPGLTGFQAGTSKHVWLQLFVNGEQKTFDGNPPAGANRYADFTVTP